MRFSAFLLGLALLCHSGLSRADAAFDYKFGLRAYSSDDGLPNSGVTSIVQAHDGYLWVGTFDGLARFDGATFTTFHSHPGTERRGDDGPASDRISTLLDDSLGRLWIGTEDAGLSIRDHAGFRHLPACAGRCQVNGMQEDADGSIWVASGAGLLNLDPSSGKERRRIQSPSSGDGYTRVALIGQNVFVGGTDGLHLVTRDTLQSIPLPEGGQHVRLLRPDGDGLLVGTEKGGYRYLPDRHAWQPLVVGEPKDAVQDANGLWWISMVSGHVLHQDGHGDWSEVAELSMPGVANLVWDVEGDLWVSGGARGLLKTRLPIFGLVSQRQLGTNMAGRAVVSDGRDGLWLGSTCGGLFHRGAEGQVRSVPTRQTLHGTCVYSLLLDREGRSGWGWSKARWGDGRTESCS